MRKILFLICSLVLIQFSLNAQATDKNTTLFPVFVKGKYGYINANGEMIIQPQFDNASKFRDGLAKVTVGSKNISKDPKIYLPAFGKDGYIDMQGRFVIEAGKFHFAEDFSEGLAGVSVSNCGNEYCYGYIDTTGNIVIKPQFKTVGKFHEGTADVRMPNGKWGVIDKTGKFIIPPIYDGAYPFYEGIGIGIVVNNKTPFQQKMEDFEFIFYDNTGKIVAKPKYLVRGIFSNGLVEVLTKKGSGFIDKAGNIVIEPKFENALGFSEGLCPVQLDNKWGFINTNGEFIIQPIYQKAFMFSNGLAKVSLNGLWGFIDKTGKVIIDIKFGGASNFEDGFAYATLGEETGFINIKGEFVWTSQVK